MRTIEDCIDDLVLEELNKSNWDHLDVTEHTFLWNEARKNCIKYLPVYHERVQGYGYSFTDFFKQIAAFSFVASRFKLIEWYKNTGQVKGS